MRDNEKQDVLVMALFVVTKEGISTCAEELSIPEEELTGELVDTVKLQINLVLGEWQEALRVIVKDTLKEEILTKRADECPLGMVCSPSCVYKTVGECQLSREPG